MFFTLVDEKERLIFWLEVNVVLDFEVVINACLHFLGSSSSLRDVFPVKCVGHWGFGEGHSIDLVRTRVECCHYYDSPFVLGVLRVVHVFNLFFRVSFI